MLLDAGADPNAKDELGHTPLHRTLTPRCHTNGSAEAIIAALLDAGADPKATMRLGTTEIEAAPWLVAAADDRQCPTAVVNLLRGQKH